MQTRLGVALLVLLLTSSISDPHQTGGEIVRNGYWWQWMSQAFKLGFISGYILGQSSAVEIIEIRCIDERSNPKSGITNAVLDEYAKEKTVTLFADYGNIRYGQLVEGTDEFYKDFKNKNIQVPAALHYVRDQLKGVDSKELEQELASGRKQAAN
jgi:hypothetical protein